MSNAMHNKRCLAAAMIAFIENVRDTEDADSLDFRIIMQENAALLGADSYLADGTMDCTCGERQVEELYEEFKHNPNTAQGRATRWLAAGTISPEQYMRLARMTQALDREGR